MKTLAFVFGLSITAVAVVGILVPASLVWLAQRFATPAPYGLAAVRIAFGLLLISVAPASRAPKGLRRATSLQSLEWRLLSLAWRRSGPREPPSTDGCTRVQVSSVSQGA